MSIAGDKAAARKAAFAVRKAAHCPDRIAAAAAALGTAIAPFRGLPVTGYLPIRTEADPRSAMTALLPHGPVGVPVVVGPARPLIFRRWTMEGALESSSFGVMVPAEDDRIVPRVLIVPLLAFDARGFRLGYGGGFYDRTLAVLRRQGPVTAIGFAFAAQEVGAVPVEATDQPLDAIVTEEGVRWL